MAIGDNTNQNLFGTNYNAEEKARKEAELAIQDAIMGAPNSLGPLLLARQRNYSNLPATGYDAPEESRASELSVFTPGGELKPGIDVDAITPSPTTLPDPSEINTALNKMVAVGSPSVAGQPEKPGFFEPGGFGYEYLGPRLGKTIGDFSGEQLYGTGMTADGQITGYPIDRPSFLGDLATLPGQAIRALDFFAGPPVNLAIDKFPGVVDYVTGASGVQAQQNAKDAQTPPEGAQEQGQSIPQGAPGSAQANFATRMATGEPLTPQEIQDAQAFAASMGTTFDPATGYSREPFENSQQAQGQASTAPTNGLTTVGGASLSEFLSGQAMPEQGFTEAEPLSGRGVTLTPDQMNELSAQREARLDARPDFGEAVSDRDRRAARGDGISMADQTAMAKANARGASPSEVARGNQVANALGVELETGQPLQATGGLTFDQIMKLQDFNFKRDQESYKREQDDLVAQGKKTEAFEKDSALLRQVSGDAGRIGRLTNEAIGLATEPGTTALSGSLLKHVAGSDANQLKSILAVISSKVALDRLMEVKKTGATLGQVSEKELAMLQNSFDALDQSLPPERLREALTNYANQLKKVEDQTQRAFIDKHGQDKFNKIMGGGSMGQGEPRFSNDVDHGAAVETHFVG